MNARPWKSQPSVMTATPELLPPPPLPVHPDAPQAAGVWEMNQFPRLDGRLLALRPTQLTRGRIATLYAKCPELLAATWPSRRRQDGWDAFQAARSIVWACGAAGLLWPEQLEREGFAVRYRWRRADGRVSLVTPQELERLARPER